jgi:NADH-quinone oxidoreductase subunit G
MASIKIGDKDCQYEGSKTILQVALDNGIEIPHYCYHPGLSVVASCRICLAEVAQPNPRNDNKLEKIPKLVPTCQHMAMDGAEVDLESEKTVANQKAVMEYLLINHPLDCPVCDQAGECFLQDYSFDYGRSSSRFAESKVKQPKKDIGDHVLLYADRCIMCTRCVRFTREVSGEGELSVQGRGNTEQIDIFPGQPLNNPLSGNVVDLCPVGALLDKEFLFEQRVWNLTSTPSIDPTTCSGDNIWIDHNEGRIWRVKPRDNEAVNQWWISDEIRYGWKFAHDDTRLKMPQHKNQGTLSDVEWPVALSAASTGLRGKKIAVLISPMIGSEEACLLAEALKQIGTDVSFTLGPVIREGEDQTFPGGYTIYAEKAPNARGVVRGLDAAGAGSIGEFGDFAKAASDADAVVVTGNYPSDWAPRDLVSACSSKFLLLIDTLPGALVDAADVVLPAAVWAEKSGSFENVHGVIQAFEKAIAPIEFARAEGQIALDLLAAAGIGEPARFNAADTREAMGGAFAGIHVPKPKVETDSQMKYVEL